MAILKQLSYKLPQWSIITAAMKAGHLPESKTKSVQVL